jgi:hypothetical protein
MFKPSVTRIYDFFTILWPGPEVYGEGDGDFEIVTRVSDEGEQSETILGVPKGLRYRPSNFEITSVQGNSIRRMRIVDDIREADLRRPVENIERNAAAGS